ncbi:TetR/AcrR family transcriptional regulator [Providencia burhodogranariea]|uniref:TetR family transcriptional regulator n=1 Tax=Providencia burhodogranariea DSM 19968 TaxID=1141662 RepID=K8WSH1_9GAMM|nr:TetR/AcrR family transcriptional regulator [Providencia burhodogranariea]EKT63533.1 TetR family transcriptional regulator [Providencia burhodogranariea DSM 19968]
MSKTPSIPNSARAKLLSAAHELFYNYGINSTGIDAIVKRANVAKKSLYNNFASKDELVAVYLSERHQEWLDLYNLRASHISNPQDGIVAVFEAYKDHAEFAYENGFRGCGLLNAAAELHAGTSGREAVKNHKEEVEAILRNHIFALISDADKANLIARHFSFLLEGSISRAGLEGKSDCIDQACNIAKQIMETL